MNEQQQRAPRVVHAPRQSVQVMLRLPDDIYDELWLLAHESGLPIATMARVLLLERMSEVRKEGTGRDR